MLTKCHKWLDSHAPEDVIEIELMYPVMGHSFLPPDRGFGQIEKETRKLEVIAEPYEKSVTFFNLSSVVNIGEGACAVYDWKFVFSDGRGRGKRLRMEGKLRKYNGKSMTSMFILFS